MAWHGITTTTHTTMYIIKSVFPLCILEQLYTLSIGLDDAGTTIPYTSKFWFSGSHTIYQTQCSLNPIIRLDEGPHLQF